MLFSVLNVCLFFVPQAKNVKVNFSLSVGNVNLGTKSVRMDLVWMKYNMVMLYFLA